MTVLILRSQGVAKGGAASARQGSSIGPTGREVQRSFMRCSMPHSCKRVRRTLFTLTQRGGLLFIGPLLANLMDRYESKKVAVSFPSLRIESIMDTSQRK